MIAADFLVGQGIQHCQQALLDLLCGQEGLSPGIIPFFKFDFVAAGRNGAEQRCISSSTSLDIAYRNRYLETVTPLA